MVGALATLQFRPVAPKPAMHMNNSMTTPTSSTTELRKAEDQLDATRGQLVTVNESLAYLRQRQSQGLSGVLSALGLSKTGNLISGYERDLIADGMQSQVDKSKATHSYELQVLKEVLNNDLDNGKSLLRQKRGVMLTTQARLLVREIVSTESAFERDMTARAEEIAAMTNPVLKDRAEKSFVEKVDGFYRVSGASTTRYVNILDEELK